jgi:hypothetical protein
LAASSRFLLPPPRAAAASRLIITDACGRRQDAIQKRLIGEVKEGKGKLAEAERLRASLASENAGLLAELARANARIAELEKELAALRCQGAGKPDAEARLLVPPSPPRLPAIPPHPPTHTLGVG